MDIIKRILRSVVFWIMIGEIILVVVLYLFGLRITYSPNIANNWEAIGASGQWAAAFVGILIPIAAVYLEHKLQVNERKIGDANSLLLVELTEYKKESKAEIDLLKQNIKELINKFENIQVIPIEEIDAMFDDIFNKNINTAEKSDKEIREELKEETLKKVNMSMVTETSKIAKILDIDVDTAFDILYELFSERKISSGGAPNKNKPDDNIWKKK